MVEGKTTGRRIFCKFIIDSDCIEEMTPEKIEVLRNNLIERGEDTISLDYSTKNKTLPHQPDFALQELHYLQLHYSSNSNKSINSNENENNKEEASWNVFVIF